MSAVLAPLVHVVRRFATGRLEKGDIHLINRLAENARRPAVVLTWNDPPFSKMITRDHVYSVVKQKVLDHEAPAVTPTPDSGRRAHENEG